MRLSVALLLVACLPASARTLAVGPGADYPQPQAAALAAQPGDTVRIAPGTYGCAVWLAPGLTIQGAGADRTVITGPVCRDKALFVIGAPDITIRDLTLRGARSPGGNAAGLLAEAPKLTAERVRFDGDQNGILTGALPDGTLRVHDSVFVNNGACLIFCAHAIYAGRIATLEVTGSHFVATQTGHAIKSRARDTLIERTAILDGPSGTSSYAIDTPDGGTLTLRHVSITKGARAGNPTAIATGEESRDNGSGAITLDDVRISNEAVRPVLALLNRTAATPTLTGIKTQGSVIGP